MANLGYIQVVRHCNHACGFCSNPSSPTTHSMETMIAQIEDLRSRGYYGVILTGGEPTLHPEIARIAAEARDRGLHVRLITNGSRTSDPSLARELFEAGVQLLHVSIYSVRPDVEARLRGREGTLEKAFATIENARRLGMEVNLNCVINKDNADHLHENVEYIIENHPHVRHFVWNNLDPSMGRAEHDRARYTPRLADFELSLRRASTLLQKTNRSFRVEKVPLCYMTDFAWASTETRKIVKGEERIVHFLDEKSTVRQTDWGHLYASACEACSLRTICAGLFDRGGGYDPAELHPIFVDMDSIVQRIIEDPDDPSYPLRSIRSWRADFERRLKRARAERSDGK